MRRNIKGEREPSPFGTHSCKGPGGCDGTIRKREDPVLMAGWKLSAGGSRESGSPRRGVGAWPGILAQVSTDATAQHICSIQS